MSNNAGPAERNDEFTRREQAILNPQQMEMISNFRNQLVRMLTAEERILYDYAHQTFRGNPNTHIVMSIFIDRFINAFLRRRHLNAKFKNIFLCILRIINPPKRTNREILDYLTNLVHSCSRREIYDILENYKTTAASLLVKLINERVYEETSLHLRGKTQDNGRFRKFHFLRVGPLDVQRRLCLKQLNSFVFEEVVALGLEATQPVLCAIHLPHSGDIMLRNGERVEVKINSAAAESARETCEHFVTGNDNGGEHEIVRSGVAINFAFTFRDVRRPTAAYLNTRLVENMDLCLATAVRLSGINVPRGISVRFLDLLLGNREQRPVNPYLRRCLSVPPPPHQADGLPRTGRDARAVISSTRMLPAIMMRINRTRTPRQNETMRATAATPHRTMRQGRGSNSASAASALSTPRNSSNRNSRSSAKMTPKYMQGQGKGQGPRAEGRKTSKKNKGKKSKKK